MFRRVANLWTKFFALRIQLPLPPSRSAKNRLKTRKDESVARNGPIHDPSEPCARQRVNR